MIFVCESGEVPQGEARNFTLVLQEKDSERDREKNLDVILWRQETGVKGFVNSCPHLLSPLETFPHHLLDDTRRFLVCSTHGARFDTNGACVSGPCVGERLQRLALKEEAGKIMLAVIN